MIHVGPYAWTVDSTTIAGVLPRQAAFPRPNAACRRGWP